MLTRVRQLGLTLIEMIITIVILAISLLGITFFVNTGLQSSSDALLQLRTAALAQAYLDEILGKRYDERTRSRGVPPCRSTAPPARQCSATLGPDGTETRARYDDVDDYHGMEEGEGFATALQDANGNTRSGYDGFSIEVDVRYIAVTLGTDPEFGLGQNGELDDQYDAKLIQVTVTHSALPSSYIYSAYKSNF